MPGPVNQVNISPGDSVVRGPYWRYDNQDGEPGNVGKVAANATSQQVSVMVRWPHNVEKPYTIAPGFATISELCHIRNRPNDDIYDIIVTLFGIVREVFPAKGLDGKPDVSRNTDEVSALIASVMVEFITATLPPGFAFQ